MIGVVIVSPLATVRAGLRALLGDEEEIRILGSAGDGGEADADPDVLLVDVPAEQPDLPARLAARYPLAAQVLLLDGPDAYTPPDAADRPWAALLKDAAAEEILAALCAVARGLVVLDPAFLRAPARGIRPPAGPVGELDEPLTAREGEVLSLLALGLPNKSIAARLGISEHTAKFHVGSILGKLGAASRTEAVAQAARIGVLVL